MTTFLFVKESPTFLVFSLTKFDLDIIGFFHTIVEFYCPFVVEVSDLPLRFFTS